MAEDMSGQATKVLQAMGHLKEVRDALIADVSPFVTDTVARMSLDTGLDEIARASARLWTVYKHLSRGTD